MQNIRNRFSQYHPITPKIIRTHETLNPNEYDCPHEVTQTFSKLTNSVTYHFKGNTIRFFYSYENCDEFVQHIARLLSVIQTKPVVADILLSSAKKFYPKDCVFGKSHLNTGYCTGDKIVVFRKEEWFKVFIHEYFHYANFDELLRGTSSATPIQTAFNLKQKIHLNESYCEVSARVIQCCYISALTHLPVEYLYEIERQHSIQNMVNVLHRMKMDYESFFQEHSFKEDTNTFSYIVIAGLLMYLYFVPVYHENTKFRMRSPKAYIHHILNHCRDDSFIQELSLLIPGITTTMSILQINNFST